VLDTVTVVNHYARDDEAHTDLGRTNGGTPIKLDTRFVTADFKVVVGLVEPHFMAGFSGGRKLITPGIAHAETITTLHSSRFMSHPRCKELLLAGNPLHEEQIEIAVSLVATRGAIHAVNTVLDDQRRLCCVTYGEIVASHEAAVDFVRRYAVVAVPQRFPTVVTSSAGYPLDKSYYQTVKGMVTCLDICEQGGDLIICSEMSEGLGSSEFRESQENLLRLGPEAFQALLASKSHASIDEWQTEMLLKALARVNVYLFSPNLREEDRLVTGVHIAESFDECVAASARRQKGPPRVAVIPEGPYVVPRYSPDPSGP